MTPAHHAHAATLADAFLAGSWTLQGLVDRGRIALGAPRPQWLPGVVKRVIATFPDPPHTRRRALIDRIASAPSFVKAMSPERRPPLAFPFLGPAEMGPRRFPVPDLATPGDLARWLGIAPNELDWLADRRGLLRRHPPGPLQHYSWRWVAKRSGGLRLIEAPKRRMRAIQRQILAQVLDCVPAHDAAHGFRASRSVRTWAAPHAGRDLLVRVDLRDFFATIGVARVAAVFRALGYPEPVALALTGLCTSRVPPHVGARAPADAHRWLAIRRMADAHLPQGAPTSPALANLVAFGLDSRLTGLAAEQGCAYTRYADDLAFSGSFRGSPDRFLALVHAIAADEGFAVNHAKTRVRSRAARQELGGIVVNERPTVARAAVKALEATLYNCVRRGPAGENREGHADFRAHLVGRVAWVRHVDPRRAERLDELLAAVLWDA